MTRKIAFTTTRLNNIEPPEKGRVEYHDTTVPKLVLRVSHTGNKSFAVLTRTGAGKITRVGVGKYPGVSVAAARKKAVAVLADISEGIDPVAQKRKVVRSGMTLAELMADYTKNRDLKPGTVADYKKKLNHIGWNDRAVSSITDDLVLKKWKELSARGKTIANTSGRVLRLLLNYAVAVNAIDRNPAEILSKARQWHRNKRRVRIIPREQLGTWWSAAGELEPKYRLYVLMMLHMGTRCGETRELEWQHIDLSKKTLTLIDPKNRMDCTLPVPSSLIKPFLELKVLTGNRTFVFPDISGDKPMIRPSKVLNKLVAVSGVEFSPHDLRRTFATIAEAQSIPLTTIKRLMNHKSADSDVTGGYIRTELNTLREAAEKISAFILGTVEADQAKVSGQTEF